MPVIKKADDSFFRMDQLFLLVSPAMHTHFKVACKQLAGSIMGAAHAAKSNIAWIKVAEKIELLKPDYQTRYGKPREQLN